MSPLLLIVPVIAVLLAPWSDPDAPSSTAVQPAAVVSQVAPPPADLGIAAFSAAKEHLAAGRLPMAAYFFEQAAQHGYGRAEVYEALAYVHYRQDNVEGGDAFLALAEPSAGEGEWRILADGERAAAARRIAAVAQLSARPEAPRPAPRPAISPASVTPTPPHEDPRGLAVDEISPGTLVGAHACGALIAGQRGKSMNAVRFLGDRGVDVDCLVSEDGPAPAVTTIWYQDGNAATAKAIAAMLPGGAALKPTAGLANSLEIRLGRSFIEADETALLGELVARLEQR